MHSHTTYQDGCFACKLKTLEFGIVPGGYRQESGHYIDTLAVEEMFPREGYEQILDDTDGVGTLRPDWRKRRRVQHVDAEGNPTSATYTQDLEALYKRDRQGEWEQASERDIDKVLFGPRGKDEDIR